MGSRKCTPLNINVSVSTGLDVAVSVARGISVKLKICHPIRYVPVDRLVDAYGSIDSFGEMYRTRQLTVAASGAMNAAGAMNEYPTGGKLTDDDGNDLTDDDGDNIYAPYKIYASASGQIDAAGDSQLSLNNAIVVQARGSINAEGFALAPQDKSIDASGVIDATGRTVVATEEQVSVVASGKIESVGSMATPIAFVTNYVDASGSVESDGSFTPIMTKLLDISGAIEGTGGVTPFREIHRVLRGAIMTNSIDGISSVNVDLENAFFVEASGSIDNAGAVSVGTVIIPKVTASGSVTAGGQVTPGIDPYVELLAPANLRFCQEVNLLEIQWDAVANAVDYVVERSVGGGAFNFFSTTTNLQVYDFDPIDSPAVVYAYRITPRNGDQTGPYTEGSTTWNTTNQC